VPLRAARYAAFEAGKALVNAAGRELQKSCKEMVGALSAAGK
jgi:hypothetical protein